MLIVYFQVWKCWLFHHRHIQQGEGVRWCGKCGTIWLLEGEKGK
jgi:hypothetical protein